MVPGGGSAGPACHVPSLRAAELRKRHGESVCLSVLHINVTKLGAFKPFKPPNYSGGTMKPPLLYHLVQFLPFKPFYILTAQ